MDEAPFVAGLDLRDALATTARSGAAFVSDALTGEFLARLQEEVERGPFRPLPEEIGPVRQETEAFEIRGRPTGYPRLAELRRTLVRAVREQGAGIRGLATWRPTEVSVQRYRGGAVGITPHLDGKRYRRLVAVFTTSGRAWFTVCRDRGGEPVEEWETVPGSLVLLRGPGLGGVRDGRPFHRVSGPGAGVRTSVGFRMEVRRPS
jgi:hypothetical protein